MMIMLTLLCEGGDGDGDEQNIRFFVLSLCLKANRKLVGLQVSQGFSSDFDADPKTRQSYTVLIFVLSSVLLQETLSKERMNLLPVKCISL